MEMSDLLSNTIGHKSSGRSNSVVGVIRDKRASGKCLKDDVRGQFTTFSNEELHHLVSYCGAVKVGRLRWAESSGLLPMTETEKAYRIMKSDVEPFWKTTSRKTKKI
jgi:hypothetical protein